MISAWKRLGLFMARITTPIFITILFVFVFTPLALVLRLLGRRPLREPHEGHAATYWITVAQRGQRLADFKRPF